MKKILWSLLFFSFNAFSVESLDYASVEKKYSAGIAPMLENHVETSMAGRCIHKFNEERTQASAMLVSFGEQGFEIAALTEKNRPVDFFDHLSWFQIFEIFPEVASQFLVVYPGDNSGLIIKKDIWGVDRGELRETEKFFIIKVFKREKFYRYCYYQK